MQPPGYPTLYVVLLSSGQWAVCCERCQRTVVTCHQRQDAEQAADWHLCDTPAADAPTGQCCGHCDQARSLARYLHDHLADRGELPADMPAWIYQRPGYDHPEVAR